MNRRTFLQSAIVLVAAVSAAAQPAEPPCSRPEASQFDFWIGEWDLSWGEDGAGSNSVSKALDGCVVVEEFDGTPSIALRGTSVSTFDARAGVWKQTWVDNQGGYLDFTGGFADGRMVLQRTAERDGEEFLQRMVWYDIEPDALDWNWERSTDGGETWDVQWRIRYERRR